jgi:pimeloyl-ACP methyl ester carboxylesterase
LCLYSHAYDPPGSPLAARDDETATVHIYLFSHGYALAASSYASSGWAIDSALPDQIAVLDTFSSFIGKPKRTIALGASLGGMVTAGLVQKYSGRFDGALSVSGILARSVGFWNELLDAAFAFNTLLVPPGSGLQVVNAPQEMENYAANGTLPTWFERTLGATPTNSQGGSNVQ